METKIELKDVIHLYLGCEMNVLREDGHTVEKLTLNASKLVLIENNYYDGSEKLLLRPLSDMTKEERNELDMAETECNRMIRQDVNKCEGWKYAVLTAICLKHNLDVFYLIESGQAIDKTKL